MVLNIEQRQTIIIHVHSSSYNFFIVPHTFKTIRLDKQLKRGEIDEVVHRIGHPQEYHLRTMRDENGRIVEQGEFVNGEEYLKNFLCGRTKQKRRKGRGRAAFISKEFYVDKLNDVMFQEVYPSASGT